MGKLVYRGIGFAMVGLATAGVFLPVLPTTPFLLVAAWAFARSSPELAEKLRNHPRFGRFLRDWQDRGAIPVRAKVLAITMMAGSWGILALTTRNVWVLGGVAATLSAVAVYLITRPNA
ncbi:YbaN family protein [Phenylobacterium sp.]|uniref:YbaN family protein n=1 Tax=Phenylobacterium sp. TaxID=1871053 RepID=UPI0025F017B5|nr:YbaN family protein [Phenylobacterium sp.]MBX3484828.1 YbaN family protein [Phenylobacterium sp.]MCW5759379.1 YbaN family protein [Phenylobacterium sp.]